MPRKNLLRRVNYDNVQHEIGDAIDIRDEDVAQLESAGAIADAPEAPAESAEKKAKNGREPAPQ